MKLNDYKKTLGALRAPSGMRERILKNCMEGKEPSCSENTVRRDNYKFRRVLSIAAMFIIVVAVASAMIMITRFIGPETQGSEGTPGEIIGPQQDQINGFRLVSVESTLSGLTAQINSFDAATKTVMMSWVNNSGINLTLGREYNLYKLDGETWGTNSFEKLNTILWEEDAREFQSGTECSNYGVVRDLTKWSDNITSGTYKVEKEFWGDGGPYIVTIIFELLKEETDVPDWTDGIVLSNFRYTSTAPGLVFELDNYSNGKLTVDWTNEAEYPYFYSGYHTLYVKQADGSWFLPAKIEFDLGEGFYIPIGSRTYQCNFSLGMWLDENISAGDYKIELGVRAGKNSGTMYKVELFFTLEKNGSGEDQKPITFNGLNVISIENNSQGKLAAEITGYETADQYLSLTLSNISESTLEYHDELYVQKNGESEWQKLTFTTSEYKHSLSAGDSLRLSVDPDYWGEADVRGLYKVKKIFADVQQEYEVIFTLEFTDYAVDESEPTTASGLVFGAESEEVGGVILQYYGITGIGNFTGTELKTPTTVGDAEIVMIGSGAFRSSDITSVVITNNIQLINGQAFALCTKLKSVSFGNGVVKIAQQAFSRCTALRELTFNEGLETIGSQAFYKCTALKEISLPSTLKEIRSSAFAECINLKTIQYNGSKAEWEAIQKDENWDLNMSNYTVYCTDGNIKY